MKRTKTGSKQKGWWPYEKRVEVISAWIATGTAPLVEGLTGVPAGTVRQWRCQDWWKEMEAQLRTEGNLELDAKLKKIVNKSLDMVMDRLENGEYIFNVKTGKVERIPAKLRDVAKVASETIDKSVLLQKFTTKVEEAPKLDDHLKKLAQEFANIIKGTANAIHERRQEGLQEGTPVGTQDSPEPSQGSSGPEQGPGPDGEEGGEGEDSGEGHRACEGDVEGRDDDSGESGDSVDGGKSVVFPQQ